MTDAVLKQVPLIIENPILVMQSKSIESRLTMFGAIVDEKGTPVLAILELHPKNKRGLELDELKLASAYGKSGAQNLINSSEILYIGEEKNRTDKWLRDNRLQLPFSPTTYGSIHSISQNDGKSNTLKDQASVSQTATPLLTDTVAESMLGDHGMMGFLTRKGGLKLTSEMTRAEKRQAVKEAVTRIARKGDPQTAGKESGFVQDGEMNMAPEEVSRLDAVCKALGVRARFVDQIDGGIANGKIQGSEILLARDVQDPVAFVIAHEWTHRIQDLAPEEYKRFREALGEDLYGRAEELKGRYEERGFAMTQDQLLDEAAADMAGELLQDGQMLDQFLEKHRTDKGMLEKLLEAIRDIIGKLTGTEKAQAQTVEGKLTAALEAAADQAGKLETQGQKNTTMESGESKFSLKEAGGKQVVWLESNPLTNKQLNSHVAVAEYIAQHIGEVYTIIESGQSVYIGKDLPAEYTQSKYTSYLRRTDSKLAKAKNKAVSGLNEIIETATNRRWEKTKHSKSKDAKYGMYRYDSTFAFPVKEADGNMQRIRAYDVELLIRNASDGKKYLYDIVNIKENTTAELDLTKKETRFAAHRAASRGDASMNSIP